MDQTQVKQIQVTVYHVYSKINMMATSHDSLVTYKPMSNMKRCSEADNIIIV